MIIKKADVNKLFLFVFLFVCVFFPGDPYNIKLYALFILLIINAGCIVNNLFSKQFQLIALFGFAFPIVVMIQSTLLTRDVRSAISGAYSPVILILLIPIICYKLPYRDMIIVLLKCMAILIISLAVADIVGLNNVNENNFIRKSFYDLGMGAMGKSAAYSSYYRIFMKASPLLVLLLDDSISKRKYIWIILSFASLWFSGTRANVLSAFIIMFIRYAIWNDNKMNNKRRIIVSLIMIVGAIILAPRIYNNVEALMSTSGAISSDMVRSGEFEAYVDLFKDPANLVLGSGFGSQFFNIGRDHYSVTSELSYFEMIRCTGLIFAIPFFIFIFIPIFSKAVQRDYKLSYICYLIIAATNPLLFSSTAMVMYIFMFVDIFADDKRELMTMKDCRKELKYESN